MFFSEIYVTPCQFLLQGLNKVTLIIFEKLILKRILDLQKENNIDLTGQSQHRFKNKRSATTLSLTIQTIIAQALYDDCEAHITPAIVPYSLVSY